MSDVWPVVIAERAALIQFLEKLSDEQWDEPSLCAGWTVHDAVAHVIDSIKTTRLNFVTTFVAARFDFDRQNARGVQRERGATPAETLERLRAVEGRTTTPPGSLDTRLVEAFVHGEDIRRPLGATGDYPVAAVLQALRYQLKTAVSFGGGKEKAAGLTLRATDTEFAHGEGPEVSGPALSLLLAVSGRSVALPELDGPGASELQTRLA